jgi:hypothetical protein
MLSSMEHPAASPFPAAVELDALRLLTLVHQLGEPLAEVGEPLADAKTSLLRGERLLLALDHLVRHPATLALLLIDAFERLPQLAGKRAALLRRLRWLLDAENTPPAPTFRRARSRVQGAERRLTLAPAAIPWRRRDDALAHLTCRALLAVEPLPGSPPLAGYRITPRGVDLLEQRFYPAVKIAAAYQKRCAAVREYLPDWQTLDFEASLAAIGDRLEDLRREEQLPRELDVIPSLFERVFRERL